MYLGSVRFFKHLIIAVILVLIFGLTISTICLVVFNRNYEEQISDLQSELQAETVLAQSNDADEEGSHEIGLTIEYQELYPDMYVSPAEATKSEPKTVYLSFDDGPSDRTAEILDILKEEDVKATFFVIGKEGNKHKDLLKRITEEGHTLGIHTYSHVYESIYSSVESYLEDFSETYHLIYETTGVRPEVFRFPGGSINTYNARFYEEIIAEMTRRGFTYYDWNASSGDAAAGAATNTVLSNTVQSSEGKDRIILLMHDSIGKSYTVSALPEIIEYYRAQGFKFERITNDVTPIAFNYINY
ncbi:MAG TPA: polysaccharide deacetylase family protein [Anaerovoracaceae bacterium]|nr:polysaccharide deacetylase family protein [Anaerovoracaceae bacterium]